MFTGLVERTGKIIKADANGATKELDISLNKPFKDLIYGESIAINGICLTLVEELAGGVLRFHALEETLKRTNLEEIINKNSSVNLERAMQANARFGGHIVSGHVDCVAKILEINDVSGDFEYKIEMPKSITPYLVEKGSITIDGISLTIVEVGSDFFTVHLIPVTRSETAIGERKVADKVNLEADILGKYIERQLSLRFSQDTQNDNKSNSLSMTDLFNAGF
ncbi:riboflavin synthase [Lentisphaerota bacterium WC36G]|nr:riboflavin synthase [Lentisphaerae bacterium WC36]